MPIEIRELIIKTEISATGRSPVTAAKEKQLDKWRKQLLEECRKMIAHSEKRNVPKR
jgi:hypothetical protein